MKGPRTWAVVPFRGRGGKRRLAELLDEEERFVLSRAMLEDVLAALDESAALDRVVVVTPDADAVIALEQRRVDLLPEPPGAGLNGALVHTQHLAISDGCQRLLIVPADVPLIAPDDIIAMLEAGSRHSVVIAPNTAKTGTNALLMRPPDAITPQFGQNSFAAHLAEAVRLGLTHATLERHALSFDVDRPTDIAGVLGGASIRNTFDAARSLGLPRRLQVALTPALSQGERGSRPPLTLGEGWGEGYPP